MYDFLSDIHTDRLLLREFEKSDVDDVFEYSQNPNVGPRAGWAPHKTKRESKYAVKSFIESRCTWAIVYRGTNKVIGTIGLHPDDKRHNRRARMMGYSISEEYWGMGLATEAAKAVLRHAFEVWKLDLVSIHHFPENEKSKRVIEKCGFTYEGTIRFASQLFNEPTARDNVCYSMTRDEYEKIYGEI